MSMFDPHPPPPPTTPPSRYMLTTFFVSWICQLHNVRKYLQGSFLNFLTHQCHYKYIGLHCSLLLFLSHIDLLALCNIPYHYLLFKTVFYPYFILILLLYFILILLLYLTLGISFICCSFFYGFICS